MAMGRSSWIVLCLGLFLFSLASATEMSKIARLDVALNSSKGGFNWVTGIDEEDLARVSLLEDAEGGFPTLDSMLQWAIGNSDPEKLKDSAQEAMKLTPEELAKRRADIKELMEKMKMPSDAELMKIAINDLNNSSLSVEDRQRALNELLELVEPIDNANDLHKLGGLQAVINELSRPEEALRTTAAWVLGKASQNNRLVQSQILERDVLSTLLKMLNAVSEDEAVKALYAVSAVIRNYPAGHVEFYRQGGAKLLQDLLSNSSTTERLTRKCLFLVADLAEQLATDEEKLFSREYEKLMPQDDLLKSVVQLLKASDLDTKEKALMAVKSLSRVSKDTRQAFKTVCNLDSALENLRLVLKELMLQEDHSEFAQDMETLRQEVLRVFQEEDS